MKSDIFFFVATIALVVISIGIAVAIVYVVLILRNVKEFSDRAKEEGKAFVDDMKMFRENLKSKGGAARGIFDFFISRILTKTMSRKRTSKKEDE
jgi:hypothetical protein